MRTVGETQGSIQVLMHHHLTTRQGCPPAHALDLQAEILKAHRVVAVHRAFELQREDQVQVPPTARQKCASALCRSPLKSLVKLGEVVLPQKAIGGFQTRDLVQSEFLRQAPLPGREVALAASPRLRRVGRDHLHPPTRAAPVPTGSDDADPPCHPPLDSARNGFPDRCTARRTRLCARSLPAVPPSPSRSIPLPPAGRSKSRWWHRPESRSGRTSARPETTGAGSRRCATASPAGAAARAACDAPHACAPAPPALLPAAPASPRCNSVRSRARPATSRESAAR